jgi:hypothetical protein
VKKIIFQPKLNPLQKAEGIIKPYTPPSAPPGVTIGNFGFFHTLKDDFYTKL